VSAHHLELLAFAPLEEDGEDAGTYCEREEGERPLICDGEKRERIVERKI